LSVAAASGENHEWRKMYPDMAKAAREEGFQEIALLFDFLARIEKEHEARYAKILRSFEAGTIFAKPQTVKWRCRNCGFTVEATRAPQQCPACKHPQAYFEVAVEDV
jgi:rubrerythrin